MHSLMEITFLTIFRSRGDLIVLIVWLLFRKAAKSRNKAIKNKPNSAGSVSTGPAMNDLPAALPQTKCNKRGRKVGVTVPLVMPRH